MGPLLVTPSTGPNSNLYSAESVAEKIGQINSPGPKSAPGPARSIAAIPVPVSINMGLPGCHVHSKAWR